MGILDFPTEVQLAIAELLPLCDLSALSMTSKGLRHLTEPLIYSSIRMTWTLQDHPTIVLLLRTILERPELGSYIRRLKLDGEGFLQPSRQWIAQNPAALPNIVLLQAEKLSRAADSAGVEENTGSWVHEAQSGSPNAVVAFLLSLLPNLEWLSLSCNWTNEIKYIGLVFKSALCKTAMDGFPPRLPVYESLKHVELAPRVDTDHFLDPENTLDALSLFYLPNIEHLSVCIDNPIEFSWPCSTPPNPLLLTSLELDRIRETRLEPLLSALKSLRKLQYNWFYQADMDPKVSNRVVKLDTMAAALAVLRDTLTELTITGETQPALSMGEYDPPDITFQGSLGQLSQLHKLKRMNIPWLFLMGMTESPPGRIDFNLPPNVENLALPGDLFEVDSNEWDDEMIISALRSELENGALSRMGCLKNMTVSGSYCLNREPSEYLRDIEALSVQFNLEVMDSRKDFIKTGIRNRQNS
ncbi:F-box domain-containing protein [Fusarium keratoplasticum]|uniref:F-box domain-containing protein n=1 Tax=Fusarium keratoplasticum TaxID=1328300 RepID=A0ACC0R5V0_9HYPO|nr:F-box domain-containing protein [Fusarium keratoplasticum]KAI8671881.1 F-box domain-containing protein [Fusarium keratoplasticum]